MLISTEVNDAEFKTLLSILLSSYYIVLNRYIFISFFENIASPLEFPFPVIYTGCHKR